MKRVLAIGSITTLGILLIAASLAFAYGPGMGWGYPMMGGPGYGPGGGPGYGCGQAFDDDDGPATFIPAEKQEAAQKLFAAHREKVAKLRQQMFAKRGELDQLLASPESDERKIDAAVDDLGGIRSQIIKEQIRFGRQFQKEIGVPFPSGYRSGPMAGGGGPGGCPGAGWDGPRGGRMMSW